MKDRNCIIMYIYNTNDVSRHQQLIILFAHNLLSSDRWAETYRYHEKQHRYGCRKKNGRLKI